MDSVKDLTASLCFFPLHPSAVSWDIAMDLLCESEIVSVTSSPSWQNFCTRHPKHGELTIGLSVLGHCLVSVVTCKAKERPAGFSPSSVTRLPSPGTMMVKVA